MLSIKCWNVLYSITFAHRADTLTGPSFRPKIPQRTPKLSTRLFMYIICFQGYKTNVCVCLRWYLWHFGRMCAAFEKKGPEDEKLFFFGNFTKVWENSAVLQQFVARAICIHCCIVHFPNHLPPPPFRRDLCVLHAPCVAKRHPLPRTEYAHYPNRKKGSRPFRIFLLPPQPPTLIASPYSLEKCGIAACTDPYTDAPAGIWICDVYCTATVQLLRSAAFVFCCVSGISAWFSQWDVCLDYYASRYVDLWYTRLNI
jgi:hypothetical protein